MSDKAKDVLLVKTQQVMASAELLASETNDWQTIQAYMTRRLHDIQLTEVQQAKLARYEFIYNQLVSGKYTESEVCEMVQDVYKRSYQQALQDIRDSKEIFSSSVNINKQFEIRAQLEINRMLTRMAQAAGDFRAAAQFEKNRTKLISMQPEADDTAAEDFTPHVNVFTFDPTILGLDPLGAGELRDLLRDIKNQYGGTLKVNLDDIQEAEIIEDGH